LKEAVMKRSLLKIARTTGPLAAGALALTFGLAKPHRVNADDASAAVEKRERCATRLSVAFLGKSAAPDLFAAADPQEKVSGLLADPQFVERFARFVNAELNDEPGETIPEDASYTLAKYVLTNDKPWKDMFVGKYDVTDTVAADATGLGYFRSDAWMRRYAGNETAGYRIVAAYRILQNTTGLELTATTNVDGVDLSAKGREAPACAGCHFQKWYALDKVARVLSKRQGTGANMTFVAPTDGPQQILDGQTITNDQQLVESLVASEDFTFNVCRLAFKYLYGRAETTCEGVVFDKCIDSFKGSGSMKDAIAAIAKDPTFCQ
jgi:hypothetical protein